MHTLDVLHTQHAYLEQAEEAQIPAIVCAWLIILP